MKTEEISKAFVQEFVLGFGFLSGLWINAGIDPEVEIIKALSTLVQQLAPNPVYSFLFWIVPIIATLASLVGSYSLGGWLGLIAVGLALLGGIFISSTFGVILLILGIIMGFIAPFTFE